MCSSLDREGGRVLTVVLGGLAPGPGILSRSLYLQCGFGDQWDAGCKGRTSAKYTAYQMIETILRTTKLCADSDCEAGAVFERARAGDALVHSEVHPLLGIRMVREHLLPKRDRRRGADHASGEIEFDPVDLHIFPNEAEELV